MNIAAVGVIGKAKIEEKAKFCWIIAGLLLPPLPPSPPSPCATVNVMVYMLVSLILN